MDDPICEIIEAYEAARQDFDEGDKIFEASLYVSRNDPESRARKCLTKRLIPVLKRHILSDRIAEINGLLSRLQSEYPDAHVRLFGKGKGSIWNGLESFLLPFGPDFQFETPEAALYSLLSSTALADQLETGKRVDAVIETEGRRFKVTLLPAED